MAELRIYELLQKQGRTQRWLAEMCGLNPVSLNNIINKGRTSLETLEKIALVLDVQIGDLFADRKLKYNGLKCPFCGAKIEVSLTK